MVVVICNSPHDFVITKKSADEFLWAFVKPVYKTISQTVWLFSEDGRERLNISIIQNVDSHMILYPPKSDLTTAVINPAVNPAVNLAANPSVNQATSPTISTSVTPTVNQVVNPTVPLKPHNISTTFRPSTVPAIKKKNATDTKNETKVKYVGEPFERFLVNLSDNNYYNPYIKVK
ncbi:hypothetical protein Btru_067022 [Bulinus truncatus]|nr:hypothetical protein Btru_067022 [Bulinus truncatus]